MEVDQPPRGRHSRRSFFKASGVTAAGGSATFLAACGSGSGSSTAPTSSSGNADVDILNSALDLENVAIATYTAGAPLLRGKVRAYGRQLLAQEREHARGLEQAIRDLGGLPNKAKPAAAYAAQRPALRDERDVLVLAKDLENTAIAAYIDAIPKLSDGSLRGTVAAIVTDEAEHVAILLEALGNPPIAQTPDAFVVGRKS